MQTLEMLVSTPAMPPMMRKAEYIDPLPIYATTVSPDGIPSICPSGYDRNGTPTEFGRDD